MLFVPIYQSVDVESSFGYSYLQLVGPAYAPYYAMGAELSMDYLERSKVTFCRGVYNSRNNICFSTLFIKF